MALLKIFKTSIDTLQKLETQMIPDNSKAARLTDAALQLAGENSQKRQCPITLTIQSDDSAD